MKTTKYLMIIVFLLILNACTPKEQSLNEIGVLVDEIEGLENQSENQKSRTCEALRQWKYGSNYSWSYGSGV